MARPRDCFRLGCEERALAVGIDCPWPWLQRTGRPRRTATFNLRHHGKQTGRRILVTLGYGYRGKTKPRRIVRVGNGMRRPPEGRGRKKRGKRDQKHAQERASHLSTVNAWEDATQIGTTPEVTGSSTCRAAGGWALARGCPGSSVHNPLATRFEC